MSSHEGAELLKSYKSAPLTCNFISFTEHLGSSYHASQQSRTLPPLPPCHNWRCCPTKCLAYQWHPDVTYPTDGAFVFCSAQSCTGTCEVADAAGVDSKAGHGAPNGMGFLSIYWYNPGDYTWDVFTCVNYSTCGTAVGIGPNTCYNLYDNGTPTDFYEYYYLG
ncbi:hypothetical protein J3R83DRAFT_1372 [Lanmaoa asiatica]|nr:hypothetical protein J3R83DRAFT_1372 [Lanmaoa asiatica]